MIPLDTPIYGTVTLGDLILFIFAIIVAVIIAKIAALYLKRALADRIDRGELDKLIKVIQIGIIFFGIWFALPSFNLDIGQLLVIGGTAGLIIAFASQKIVSNLGSGMFLLIERPVKIGDNIRIGSISGTVYQIRVLSTILKTSEGIYVRVPNEQVFTSDITNYVASPARRLEYRINIGHREDVEGVNRAIMALLSEHPFVLKNPEPSVSVAGLSESGIEIMVRMWAPSMVWDSLQTEMLGKIKQLLDQMGVEIPLPQRVIRYTDVQPREDRKEGGNRHVGESREGS
ncbi:MAG: mechanosensitive ion channel family protein [Methanoregulaceae archaeon]|nr:mechanosensitive ion channel family protein [Methanoregulaceae archaeon]